LLLPECQPRGITVDLTEKLEVFSLKKSPGINQIIIKSNSKVLTHANIEK